MKTQPGSLDPPQDEPIILVGDAKTMRGSVLVRNSGQDRIQVREANLRLRFPEAEEAVPFGQASLSVTLQPGQSQNTKISLDIDPLTPPGQYPGELDVNGQTRAVIAFIAEVVRLTLSPQILVIDQGSGATVVKQVLFSNEGNVPLSIGPIGQVQLGKELLLRRGVHTTLAAAGEKKAQPLQRIFAEFVQEDTRAVLGEAGVLIVRKPCDKIVLQPGESKLLELEIYLPENLETNNRYIGRVPLYTSDLEFIVVPAAS